MLTQTPQEEPVTEPLKQDFKAPLQEPVTEPRKQDIKPPSHEPNHVHAQNKV